MIDLPKTVMEKAVLVAVRTNDVSKELVEEYLDELEKLASTAGAETVLKVIQDRVKPDKTYYIGKGKAEEIAELVKLNDATLVIIDDDLTPTQVRNLERLIDKKILDRSGLILDIFASHAKTKQAKTQVELAQLQYMLPRLTRAWTHLSKQYGGIGTKGPGETQIETDRRIIRTRIAKLRERLDKIESQNHTKSQKRKRMINASLVGYTNAGKSTLINLLTEAGVLAENKLFATLDSTTRSFNIEKNKEILISDTVGFIRKLPHHLVESFKTTLNVVREADLILHIIDVTHPFFEDHIRVVDDTLAGMGCDKKQQIKVFNKVDALEDKDKIDYVLNNFENSIVISAQRGFNIGKLKDKFLEVYEDSFKEQFIKLHVSESKLVAQIHAMAEVLEMDYDDEYVNITYRADSAIANKIKSIINEKHSGY